MAGAVFRPTDSATICCLISRGIWRAISRCESRFVMTQKCLAGASGSRRDDGLLNHGLFAVKRQQLFGPPLSAQRPKSGTTPAGEDDRIEIGVRFCHGFRMLFSLVRHILVAGSGTALPGKAAFSNSSVHCGRT